MNRKRGLRKRYKRISSVRACWLLVFAIWLPIFEMQAQTPLEDQPDSVDVQSLRVIVRTHNFFKNDEYAAEKLAGYTLPGFTLEPVLRYDLHEHLSIEAGVHLLHFWGADSYPLGVHYGIIPNSSNSTSSMFHFKPTMRVRLSFGSKLHVVLGSLYNNQYHHLPVPLYNRELSYAADPEAGGQVLLDLKHFKLDFWLDWQNFSFRKSTKQEQFVMGCSAIVKPLNKTNNCTLSIPIHFLARHKGGEFMRVRLPIVTSFNAATGLEFRKCFSGKFKYLQIGCLVSGYTRSRGDGMKFQRGWGIFPSVEANAFNTTLEFGFWRSGAFVPLLGSPHFGNYSTYYNGMVFDPMSVLHAQLTYQYDKFKFCVFQLEGGLYVYLPYSANQPGYGQVVSGSVASFDLGIHIFFNPEFYLIPKCRKKCHQN